MKPSAPNHGTEDFLYNHLRATYIFMWVAFLLGVKNCPIKCT